MSNHTVPRCGWAAGRADRAPIGVRFAVRLFGLAAAIAFPAHAAADACADGAVSTTLPDVTIDQREASDDPVPHCRLDGTIGGRIGFSVWLPVDWNGRFAMGGGGGFVGTIDNQLLRLPGIDGGALGAGYATAATDTGHRADGMDARWALDDLQAIVDFGHVGVHRTAVVAKALIAEHYGRGAETAYFVGCSNGGRQALMEAQRYPDDFDAIVAGAPAASFSGTAANFIAISRRMLEDGSADGRAVVSAAQRRHLRAEVVRVCDGKDGLQDGLVSAPDHCGFDPASVACGVDPHPDCLDAPALAAVRQVHAGAHRPDGSRIHPGFPVGAEDVDANGWGSWFIGAPDAIRPGVPNAAVAFGLGYARYFLHRDPSVQAGDVDFASWDRDTSALRAQLDAVNPDLDAFRARGGKLLLYHGWSDMALSAHATREYVQAVVARDPAAAEDVRLFLVPELLHCYGGAGPGQVDWLTEIDRWARTGVAPDRIDGAFPDGSGTRPLCAWPARAHPVTGAPKVDPRDPASFECRVAD